jgi:hypothetical protein
MFHPAGFFFFAISQHEPYRPDVPFLAASYQRRGERELNVMIGFRLWSAI